MAAKYFYPALAGYHETRSLWPSKRNEEDAGDQLINQFAEALSRNGVSPEDLGEMTIPLLSNGTSLGRASRCHVWVGAEALSIDTLIATQCRKGGVSTMMSNLLHLNPHTSIPSTLADMPTLSHCVALWGFLAARPFFDASQRHPSSSPVLRDTKTCKAISKSFELYLAPHTEHHLYSIDGLHQTPCYPVLPASPDLEADILEILAARVAYCLASFRPVQFLFVEEAPSPMVAQMIALARGEQA